MSRNMNLRRNWPVALLAAVVLAGLLIGLGPTRIIAYISNPGTTGTQASSRTSYTIQNPIDLFDDTQMHSIEMLINEQDYDLMLETYRQTGEKDYFRTDVVIDGVIVRDVGVRLKGNSLLRSALGVRWGGFRPGEDRAAEAWQRPADGQAPAFPEGADGQPPGNRQTQPERGFAEGENARFLPQAGAGDGEVARQGRIGTLAAVTGSTKIPLLIKFDKYIDGQTYQGLQAIAIRTYGASYDEAMLAEPVTNAVARQAGLPAARTCYTSFTVDGKPPALYVVSEVIDSAYLQANAAHPGGVLFKAEVGSTMEYTDDNPSSYTGDFSQETRKNDADMSHLIEFLRFIGQADDARFASELPSWLDVDTFALYLAVNNLLVNRDSIAGMNNNYYLYLDETDQRFIIFLWDTNESLGQLVGGGSAEYDLYYARTDTELGRGGFGGGMFGGENRLVARFLANPEYRALYESKLIAVYRVAFLDKALETSVAQVSSVIEALPDDSELVDIGVYNQAVQAVRTFIAQRQAYLASAELLAEVE